MPKRKQAIAAAEATPTRFTAEIGRSGLKEFGGAVHEEFDADLRGLHGIKIYEEMRRNDPTIAVGLRAIGWLIGQVNWSVEPGGETKEDEEAAAFLESCTHDMSHTWSKVVRDALTCLPFGWCLPADALVLDGNGNQQQIEDVTVGQFVLTNTGKARMVEAKSQRYFNGELVEIKARGQAIPLRLTPEHRVWTQSGWKPAGDIREGDILRQPNIPLGDGGDYLSGWLVGVYLAEGHRRGDSKTTILFSVHEREAGELTEQLRKWQDTHSPNKREQVLSYAQSAPSINAIHVATGAHARTIKRFLAGEDTKRNHPTVCFVKKHAAQIGLTDTTFRAMIDEWVAIAPRGAHVGSYHQALRKLPTERDFARGIVDGWIWGDGHDGSATNGTIKGTTVSETLAWQMLMIAGSLGIPANLGRGLRREGRSPVWRVSVTPQKEMKRTKDPEKVEAARRLRDQGLSYAKIAEALGIATQVAWQRLQPSKGAFIQGLQSIATPDGILRKVEMVRRTPYSGFVYDLQVAIDHTFLASGCVVSNSWLEQTMKVRNGSKADPASRYDDGRIGWRKFTLIGQDSWSRWEFDESGGVAGLWQTGQLLGGKYSPETLIPIDKSVLFRLDDEKGNPDGVSLLRPVFNAWYSKKQIQEVEAIGIERDLTGTLIIHMPVGATKDDYSKARELVEQFKADDMAGFIAPRFGKGEHEGWSFEIIASPGSKSIDPDKAIQRYQLEIARSFLAQFLMLGQGGAGSWALARDQRGIFEVALGAILMNFDETINRFMVPPLFRLNDFGRLTALPQIKPGRISKADMDKFSKGLAALVTAGLLTPNADLERYVREEMDLPELVEVESDEEQPEEDTGRDEPPEAKKQSEPEPDEEGDFELPDPDDEEDWAKWHKESIRRIERSGKRAASELFQFARPYNYAKKLQEHQAEYRDKMRGLAEQLREGKLNHGQWAYRSQVEISRYTSDGYRLGKAQAQGVSPSKVKMDKADNKAIANSVQGQYKYFSEFAKETKAKLAAGEELTTYVDARAAKYGGSVRSAMNGAYVAGQGETKLRWVRHKDDSCPTCLEQAGKVKTGAEWAAGGILPSQNVKCNGQCGCELLPER